MARVVVERAGGLVVVTGHCMVTGKKYTTAPFPRRELEAWQRGQHIQDACRSLNAGDREFLISGTSPEGWNLLFPPEEGYDDEET